MYLNQEACNAIKIYLNQLVTDISKGHKETIDKIPLYYQVIDEINALSLTFFSFSETQYEVFASAIYER
jgi:hypothetical protein